MIQYDIAPVTDIQYPSAEEFRKWKQEMLSEINPLDKGSADSRHAVRLLTIKKKANVQGVSLDTFKKYYKSYCTLSIDEMDEFNTDKLNSSAHNTGDRCHAQQKYKHLTPTDLTNFYLIDYLMTRKLSPKEYFFAICLTPGINAHYEDAPIHLENQFAIYDLVSVFQMWIKRQFNEAKHIDKYDRQTHIYKGIVGA